jgi:FtsP/CotA-like multicopper oxidase with cupredoxin domain
MQRLAGLYGMIVVSEPDGIVEPFTYDQEHTVLLEDCWHNSVYNQATSIAAKPIVVIGAPQSLLINGRGMFNCSKPATATEACNISCPDCVLPTLFIAVPGKTYLLRIGSLTSLSSLSFKIEGHSMTVVEVDGHYVSPSVVRNLCIYSGKTYSVLLKADQDPRRSYLAVVDCHPCKTASGKSVLKYANDPAIPTWIQPSSRLVSALLMIFFRRARQNLRRATATARASLRPVLVELNATYTTPTGGTFGSQIRIVLLDR